MLFKMETLRHRAVKSHSKHAVALGSKANTMALELVIPARLCTPLLMC